MTKLLLGSVVAATLIFTGCGSDSTTTPTPTADTTDPVFTTGTTLTMDTAGTVTLAATDASAPITYALTAGSADNFTLTGSTLTAPSVAGDYNITVTATDSATTPNTATQNIAVTVNTPAAGSGIVYNGLEWTALKELDANATLSGRVTQAEAESKCSALGMTLPTQVQLDDTNTTLLKDDADFNFDNTLTSNSSTALVVWTSTGTLTGYALYQDNTNNDDAAYTDAAWTADTTNFYTCVKAAQ